MSDKVPQDDARFEDGGEAPLRLRALDTEDLAIISALCQDAVFPGSEMVWQSRQRRFALLLNRFRWEDQPKAALRRRPVERVQSVLAIEDVGKVRSQGLSRDADTIYSLLALQFEPTEDGMGVLTLTLAGDGAIALEVETLEVTLKDVTRPYIDPARRAPSHPD
ncbi:DUF2948 family protein [Frigidibacter sp. ROC022]|uniref:DUF2948 family protein n=1 Tax=Frigidibacter sp. ROC022 TaxID=2971796 RepID=UPI00215A55FC|nr:DUF2948 family protein [Frigidibacter sp. ROC022]MCR8725067.1 DUF2948 family protein [Frigidibacter sp. ROC022]